jgi:uncharacterized protein (TIGR02996 family)
MSADEAAFVRAIAAAGADPTPRLVFADWLDEHGNPDRAAFVRDQVLVATISTDTPTRRAAARAAAAEKTSGRQWAGPVARHAHDWQFRGGFPELVGLTAAKLRRNAVTLFAHSPIRSLLVTGLAGSLKPMAAVPDGNGVERLSLWGARLTADHLPALAEAIGRLPRLNTLSLLFDQLGDDSVPTLIGHPAFCALGRLELGANPFTDAGRDRLRADFGDRVSFDCEREDDWLYPFVTDYGFLAGTGSDDTQYLLRRTGDRELGVARFDLAGIVLDVGRRSIPEQADDGHELDPVLADLGFCEQPVRVKRFRFPNGWGLEGFSRGWREVFDDPAAAADDRETALDWIEHWLAGGKFAWRFLEDDYWLDRSGEVSDT